MARFNDFIKNFEEKVEEDAPLHINEVRKYLQEHPEYQTSKIEEFKYDDGTKVLTGDIYKDGKQVARLEFGKDGYLVNDHNQVFSEIDFRKRPFEDRPDYNKNFNKKKYGKYFDDEGHLKEELASEYFNLPKGE